MVLSLTLGCSSRTPRFDQQLTGSRQGAISRVPPTRSAPSGALLMSSRSIDRSPSKTRFVLAGPQNHPQQLYCAPQETNFNAGSDGIALGWMESHGDIGGNPHREAQILHRKFLRFSSLFAVDLCRVAGGGCFRGEHPRSWRRGSAFFHQKQNTNLPTRTKRYPRISTKLPTRTKSYPRISKNKPLLHPKHALQLSS